MDTSLIAQCINVGSGVFPTSGPPQSCAPGMVLRCIKESGISKVRCVQEICGPLPQPTIDVASPCSPTSEFISQQWTVAKIIGTVMSYLFPFVGIILFFVIVSAGYDYITSYEEQSKGLGSEFELAFELCLL